MQLTRDYSWGGRRSPVDGAHVRVALSGRRAARQRLVERVQVGLVKLDVGRRRVLLQVLPPLGARDRHDVVALGQEPRQGELARRDVSLGGDFLHPLDQREVLLEVLALESRRLAAPVSLGNVLGALEPAGEEASSQRAVGHKPDAQLANRGQDLLFRVAAPERVFGLERRDGVFGVGPADGRRRRLRQPQVADLPLPDQLRHGPHGLLDGDVRIDAVLVVEVDVVHAQALEGTVAATGGRTRAGR